MKYRPVRYFTVEVCGSTFYFGTCRKTAEMVRDRYPADSVRYMEELR
jgi:hypothetical protein